jgi:hypothetical protein
MARITRKANEAAKAETEQGLLPGVGESESPKSEAQQAAAMLDSPEVIAVSVTEVCDPNKLPADLQVFDGMVEKYTVTTTHTKSNEIEGEINLREDQPDDDEYESAKIEAYLAWEESVEAAKECHYQAAVYRSKLQDELKLARKREEDALELATGIFNQGPDYPKLPEVESELASPAPGSEAAANSATGEAQQSQAANTDDAWKLEPITNLPLEKIKGLGKGKKYQALIDHVPTLGTLEAKRVEASIHGLQSVMPDGIGQTVTDQLEEIYLNYITSRQPVVQVETFTQAETHSAPDSIYPTAEQWELFTDDDRNNWLGARSVQLDPDEGGEPIDQLKTSAFESGHAAGNKNWEVSDCPLIPGEAQDDWIRGWLVANKAESKNEAIAEGVEEPTDLEERLEFAMASVGRESSESSSDSCLVDVDDI